jgi:prepilin-type N-terminal cleavage/methylation domain-containing protein
VNVTFAAVRTNERGFTLIELLVTMAILMVGIAGAIALIDGANARAVVTKEREAASALGREVLESARSVTYTKLTPNGVKAELQALPGLADSTPGTTAWTVERRNRTFTVAVSVCTVDDQQDGYGDHSGGSFCSAATPSGDTNPDDYKRVTVDLEWDRP